MLGSSKLLGLGALTLLMLGPCLPSGARGAAETLFVQDAETATWQLKAQEFTYDARQGVYTARGKVQLRSQDRLIEADEMSLDALTHQAILDGEVRIEQGSDWLEGERAVLELDEQRGTIEHARGFLAENHFYFSGDLVEKLGPQTYHLEQASFTTCDGKQPSWHFRAGDLRVTVDGYGFASQTRFYVGPFPLLYTPYLVFPAKRTRQSGLLPPRVGTSGLRGTDVDLPFYWAISDDTDATFYAHYMSKRGLMPGAEFRYAVSEENRGVARFDYLSDQAQSDALRAQGFREIAPGFSGDYHERWWWRSKQDFVLSPAGIRGKMDLDFVSDRDYLREFKTGFGSFDESNRMFAEMFGRGLINDESATTRESTLQFNKTWAAHSVNADFHYFFNLDRSQDETTLQQLPQIEYSATRQPLLGGPLFSEFEGDYVDYWRPEGSHGHRLDLHPRLALPLRWNSYLYVEPSAGVRETAYLMDCLDGPEGSLTEKKRFQSRELYDLRVGASTELTRVFHMDGNVWTASKHTVIPEIVYEYIPSLDQEGLPYFDSTDRIDSKNLITYSLTNFFVARLDHGPGKVAYLDFARLKLSQSYDLNEGKREVSGGEPSRHPFSNVTLQLDLSPQQYLALTYKSDWSPYDGDFKRHDLLARLWDKRGDSLSIDYREERDESGQVMLDEIDGRLSAQLWKGFIFHFHKDYSLTLHENLETEYLLEVKRQCWGLSFSYVHQPGDRRFMIGFTLYGVGQSRPGMTAGGS